MTVSLLDDGRSAARIATALYLDDETPERVPAKADAAIQQAFLDATLRPPMRAAGPEAPPTSSTAAIPPTPAVSRPRLDPAWRERALRSNHGRTWLDITLGSTATARSLDGASFSSANRVPRRGMMPGP